MRHLAAKPLPLPTAVTAPPIGELAAETAVITPSFERGALILRRADGRLFRLSWQEDGVADDPRRALPPGKYALVGYRLLADDSQERTWHVSVSAPKIRELELESGKSLRVEIDPAIRIAQRVHAGRLQVSIQGEREAGLSIYKEGRRIPIGYEVRGPGGGVESAGKIRYG
jgi:hypothetical protein